MKTKTWSGPVKEVDDFGSPITDAFFDGKTQWGPWAIMSPTSFERFGVGLGTGLGQKYQKATDGLARNGDVNTLTVEWIKVAG